MTVTLHNTTKLVECDGVLTRIWEGETDSGIKVHAFITRVAIAKGDDAAAAQFRKELKETRRPSEAIQPIPLRLIL